jgi:hypothetical protein
LFLFFKKESASLLPLGQLMPIGIEPDSRKAKASSSFFEKKNQKTFAH